ncbi:3-oxoacyl-ACP reductase [Paraburkholderia bengalensis]|uniref:3-oxoacyl-ACP reductase n=1 Tax=Paraburkholderia bengalensis TaxID=2747562 RepID=A0ABU8J5V8_9BURK
MNDSYLNFVNSPLGARVARSLGLPKPEVLRRYKADAPEFDGIVAVGAGPAPQLLDALADVIAHIGITSVAHPGAGLWVPLANRHGLMTGRFEATDPAAGVQARVWALVFDASGIDNSAQLATLYTFFHDTLRSLDKSGRIIVLGRPPEACASPRQWTAQRALEGIVRSLGKEARRGIAANLLYAAHGAESNLEATLRFFLSPRSAYVSGQAVRIGAAANALVADFDWTQPLAGQRAVVTGAARGIGAAIANVLAAQGAHVIGVDIPPPHGRARRHDAPDRRHGARARHRAPETPAQLATALDELGVDVLVHNAGITKDKTIAKMSEAAWRDVIDINLSAQERIDDALLEAGTLRDGGRIVAVSSISGIAGNLGQTNYAASKAGVIGRVQSMAPLLARRRITINAVAPGFIETQMTAKMPLALREAGRRMNSMSQGGQPADVAQTVAWLAHPGSSGVTGQIVRVCGQSLIGA